MKNKRLVQITTLVLLGFAALFIIDSKTLAQTKTLDPTSIRTGKSPLPTPDRMQGLTEEQKKKLEANLQLLNSARAQLINVKVTQVGSSSLTVDNGGASVVVNITEKTQLRRRFWGKSMMSEFSVGDTIDVIGRWTDDTKTQINAALIRNDSIERRYGVTFGTVTTLTDTGFVMSTIHKDNVTVMLGSDTILTNRRGDRINKSDIKFGDRVRVRGVWDKANKTITEVREVKNFSLPPLGSDRPKASNVPSSTPVATPAPTSTANTKLTSPTPEIPPNP